MQWLINIIAEKVIATIGIPPVFIDRGDPAVTDYELADLIVDSDWHELDLSGIVPAGAKAVCLRCTFASQLAYGKMIFRKKGIVNNVNTSRNYTQVAMLAVSDDCTIPIGPDGKIEYYFLDMTYVICQLVVKGWWL